MSLFLTDSFVPLMRSISSLIDMGGAGFVFTGENDADIMHNSVTINLNVLEEQRKLNDHKGSKFTKIFYLDQLSISRT